ncbi:hypothetical protein QUF74_01555 [Candidatus Halobeggiatoa sp. HSG11]|nr:hypothetical protein [Candidatus Halobeggiatoa sp. HSG11]
MVINPLPISPEKIEAALSNKRVKKITLRRVLPKSVIISLHKEAFAHSVQLSATHKAIQTYTTTSVIADEQLELLKIIFGLTELSAETIANIVEKTEFTENSIKKLSTLLPHGVKKQMESTIEKLLIFGQASSRELPALSLVYAQKMVAEDIREQEAKVNQEVQEFFENINDGKIIQFGIMMDVITSNAYPFCFLNKVKYDFSEWQYTKLVDCYVLLYAKKMFNEENKLSSVAVWLQLHPVHSKELAKMSDKPIMSEIKYVSYPEGLVSFQFADTAVQVELSSLRQDNHLVDAKPKEQLIQEMKQFVRTMTAPGKKKAGIALHVTFTKLPDKSINPNVKNMWI